MTAVSVIVPARNASATIGRTLAALAAQEVEGGYEVILVDNGSDDDTLAIARSAPGPVTVIAYPEGRGAADARNRGVRASTGPILAFSDADCFPDACWLKAGVRALERAELVQGRVAPDPETPVGPFDKSLWVDGRAGLWETANLFVRRDLFERVGGFEGWLRPRFGGPIGEDVWFGWRARRTGARAAFAPDALVHHAVFQRPAFEYVKERIRLEHFPELVRRMPELRSTLCWRRTFLSRRTAAFDVGLGGVLAAICLRRPVPALAALPWLRMAWARARVYGLRRGAVVLAADAAADGTGLLALALGSARSRSLLL